MRRLKCAGPAAVGVDDFVNLLHQANGLREADNYLLVVRDVLLGERLEAILDPEQDCDASANGCALY
jgi:hypothetical protein